MENHREDPNRQNHRSSERNEPVRSRWTPKPEQILILESIFNSGMVNPPKDETVRIRKLLEKFGTVGDANVFYWFQNRRSRSRRRQRQMQAAAGLQQTTNPSQPDGGSAAAAAAATTVIHYDVTSTPSMNFGASPSFLSSSPSPSYLTGGGSSSSCGVGSDVGGVALFPLSGQQIGFPEIEHSAPLMTVTPSFCPSDNSNIHFQSGYNLIFINGIPTQVSKGSVDIKTMCGNDAVLVNSSGVPVLTNEFGFSVQSLQHGEHYFLVSRPT